MAKAIDQMAPRTRGLGISRPGFTLVEMLVVIGIIAVLAALLLPAVMRAVNSARNTAIALEVNQLASAIEAYKQDKGDYPPNFRDRAVVLRHIRKCYPKADPDYVRDFIRFACSDPTFIDEGESLVFWLSMTDSDPRFPFWSYMSYRDANNDPLWKANPKRYYDFEEKRLAPIDQREEPPVERTIRSDGTERLVGISDVRSFQARFARDTYYIYLDSRSYDLLASAFAYSEDRSDDRSGYEPTRTRPYKANTSRFVNETTFQIICAGQDGDFGTLGPIKIFPDGTNYTQADKDNITNFSNGRTLGDNLP